MRSDRPCASTAEIGAIFDEFLGMDQVAYQVNPAGSAPMGLPGSFPQFNNVYSGPTQPNQQQWNPVQHPQVLHNDIISSPVLSAPSSPDSIGCIAASPTLDAQDMMFSETMGKSKRSHSSDEGSEGSKRSKRSKKDMQDSGSEGSLDACKVARRRKQNRVAAQTSREKKKKYLNGLEQKVQDLTFQNQQIHAQLQAALAENRRLRNLPEDGSKPEKFASPPLLECSADDTPTQISVKAEKTITTFESAVFKFSQPSEVVMGFLFFLLSLALIIYEAPQSLAMSFSKTLEECSTSTTHRIFLWVTRTSPSDSGWHRSRLRLRVCHPAGAA